MNNRSERMKPKFEKLRQLKDKGVILHTIWDFEEKKLCVACGKQKTSAISKFIWLLNML